MAYINPFANLSADRYSVKTTLEYFEEVRVWAELHEPRNQVVFGHYGSGKSIALQRLRGSAMDREPRFLNTLPFFGVYINLLEIVFLDSVSVLASAESIRKHWPDGSDKVAMNKERFIALTIAEATVKELLDSSTERGFGILQNPLDLSSEIAKTLGLDLKNEVGLQALYDVLSRERAKIKAAAATTEIFSSNTGIINLQQTAQQLASVVGGSNVFSHYPNGIAVFLLIDQMEAVSDETKQIINLLLRRENSFYTKVAARVHGHTKKCAANITPLKVGDDVYPLFIGYTLDTEEEFARIASAVANNMLRAHGDKRGIADLLAFSKDVTQNSLYSSSPPVYAGLETLITLASGSVRQFLEMCSLAVRCTITRPKLDISVSPIPEECQTQAAIKLARQELERVSTSDADWGPRVRSLVDKLFREAKGAVTPIAKIFRIETENLFPEEALHEDVKRVIHAGFELDAFRYAAIADTTFGDLPECFGVAPIFAPAFGVSLSNGDTAIVTASELKKMTTPIRSRASSSRSDSEERPRLFYSTKFANQPVTTSQIKLVKDVFGAEFDVKLGSSAASGNQLSKIIREIKSSRIVLVEVSEPSPSVMLELGISYALQKRTFIMFNKDSDTDIGSLQFFIRTLDIIPYSFEIDQLKAARDKIIQRFYTDPEPGEMIEENAFGMSLRPRADEKSIFVYYPRERAVWEVIREKVQEKIANLGGRLLTVEAAPYNSTPLEEVMFCIYRSSRTFTTSCVIDTTGKQHADLIGSFALGAALAKSKGALRIEEGGQAKETSLGLWPSPYDVWGNEEELLRILNRYIRPKQAKTTFHRRRKKR